MEDNDEPLDLFRNSTPAEIALLVESVKGRGWAGREGERSWNSQESKDKAAEGRRRYSASLTSEQRTKIVVDRLQTPEVRELRAQGLRKYHESLTPDEKKEWVRVRSEGRAKVMQQAIASWYRWWYSQTIEEQELYLANSFHKPSSRLKAIKNSSRQKRPTEPEFFMGLFLENFFTGKYTYNGDGRAGCILGGLVPDFVSTDGSQVVIEVLGVYWHSYRFKGRTEEEEEKFLVDHYSALGYKCLTVWEYDCYLWFSYESERLALIERVNNLLGVTSVEATNP